MFRFLKFSDPNLKNGKFLYKNHCFWLLLNKLEDLVTPCLVSLHETMGCCPHFINGVGVRVPFKYTLGPDSYLPAQSPAWPPCSFLGLLLPTSDGFIWLFYMSQYNWYLCEKSLCHWFHHLVTLIFTLRRFTLPFRNVKLRQR